MIITRTPYRVSLFGGGTDYPQWFNEHGGAVLTSTIDRYCYVNARLMPPFLGHKYRVFWSKMEQVNRIDDIQHPAVRACLTYAGIDKGFEVNHCGDLPARSGLGSSSAFTVGMIHALYAMQGFSVIWSKSALAAAAVHIEQVVMKETVGLQDQIQCAHGGLNIIKFSAAAGACPGDPPMAPGHWDVIPLRLPTERMFALESRLMLFFTGLQRTSSELAAEQLSEMPRNTETLRAIQSLVGDATAALISGKTYEFGRLLDYGWNLKKGLSARISSTDIDDLYVSAKAAGAIGGKLLGAGGGGFLLLYVEDPEAKVSVRKALSNLYEVPFKFEDKGTQLVLCDEPIQRD